MRNPTAVQHAWLCNSFASDAPAYVQAAERQVDRHDQAAASHWIDWTPEELHGLLELVDQKRLEFDIEDTHANVRHAVARYLETVVCPTVADPALRKIPGRLRAARQTGTCMYHPGARKFVTIWDEKAGLPLLCPDDSREEGARLGRRYIPTIADWRNHGKSVHKLVLSPPNIRRGELREGMRALCKRFAQVFLRSGKFPEIKGALVTLEAPLSMRRDWNVHLNVILLCDGFLDYNKIVAAWGHQFDAQRLRGGREQIEAALREVIKYACKAMPSKSAEHKARGITEAPALTEWTADEFLEWWDAHQRFRRTRSYGVLYRLSDPEPESLEGFRPVGHVWHDGLRLRRRLPLLDSILGDKSSGESWVEAYRRQLRRLTGPPDWLQQAHDYCAQVLQA